jgi:hypothetical protein
MGIRVAKIVYKSCEFGGKHLCIYALKYYALYIVHEVGDRGRFGAIESTRNSGLIENLLNYKLQQNTERVLFIRRRRCL